MFRCSDLPLRLTDTLFQPGDIVGVVIAEPPCRLIARQLAGGRGRQKQRYAASGVFGRGGRRRGRDIMPDDSVRPQAAISRAARSAPSRLPPSSNSLICASFTSCPCLASTTARKKYAHAQKISDQGRPRRQYVSLIASILCPCAEAVNYPKENGWRAPDR